VSTPGKLFKLTTANLWLCIQKTTSRYYPGTRLPDFSWDNIPEREKVYQITIKYTKWPQNILNGHKIYPMAVKNCHRICIPTSSIARPSKIYPIWDFWFQNMPSGNSGPDVISDDEAELTFSRSIRQS
jgi:hypothetical protein